MRLFLLILVAELLCVVPATLIAQDVKYPPQGEQIPGPGCGGLPDLWLEPPRPCQPSDLRDWLADITHWRNERMVRIGFDASQYDRSELKWTQSAFIQPQMMIHERYFYDPVAGKYTVHRYLDDLDQRYGGIDSVLVWHAYPNLGIDNRNQYDLLRDMPGGVEGVKGMIADFHRRGVRVLFPVLPWDQGTRDEGRRDWTATGKLMAEIGADGINGDTFEGVPRAFRVASDATGHPIALEPEGGPADEAVQWNNLTWGYWDYGFVPGVSRYKWLEHRHMVNMTDRWARDKTEDLHAAFFNGIGYVSWENIWGIWNQITPLDAEALRRVSKIERAVADLLISPDWEPHTLTLRYGVFASKFAGPDGTVWTVVNRNPYEVTGRQLRAPWKTGAHYYDLWHGEELHVQKDGDWAILSFDMEAKGFGSVLETTAPLPENLDRLVKGMAVLSQRPLSSFSHEWKVLPQHIVDIAATKPGKAAPTGMVKIPEGDFLFKTAGIEIEGSNNLGVDVQYPWEDSPRRYHEHSIHMTSFYMDKYPVTNAEFKKFVDASHYHPADDHNFLRDWRNGNYLPGWNEKPVTWISIEDARAYASWAGKRLPHEWEWQYGAQGKNGSIYPWGDEWDVSAVPTPDKRRQMREPTAVNAYPKGASSFGVTDLVGNIWQWTDEFRDEHTRAAILKGGSYYQAQGAIWYFPQAYKLTEHGKYLLMAPGSDRSGTVGFRCVQDAE
jgi:formylglycine-generating enzyme required for sulfatase activity